jgi:hypothetical protein
MWRSRVAPERARSPLLWRPSWPAPALAWMWRSHEAPERARSPLLAPWRAPRGQPLGSPGCGDLAWLGQREDALRQPPVGAVLRQVADVLAVAGRPTPSPDRAGAHGDVHLRWLDHQRTYLSRRASTRGCRALVTGGHRRNGSPTARRHHHHAESGHSAADDQRIDLPCQGAGEQDRALARRVPVGAWAATSGAAMPAAAFCTPKSSSPRPRCRDQQQGHGLPSSGPTTRWSPRD